MTECQQLFHFKSFLRFSLSIYFSFLFLFMSPFIRVFVRFSSTSFAKKRLKWYKLPEITPEECEERHVRGWGPGGSCVNSAGNAVILKHKQTNCAVHESRKLVENVRIAYKRLKFAVDRHLNGPNSYEAQFEQLERKYEEWAHRSKEKRRANTEQLKRKGEEIKGRKGGGMTNGIGANGSGTNDIGTKSDT